MKQSKSNSKSHYGKNIPALTKIDAENQSQSRPRVVLLLILLSALTALVTVANVFTPVPSIDLGSDYDLSTKDRYGATTIDDPYNRKIRVLDNREEHEEDSEYDDYEYFDEDADIDADEESVDEDDESYYEYDWSEEQIEEMERYYQRYLEVFYAQHGYDYEPDDIEFVYTEYLKFKEQKAQERLEMEKENEQATQRETEETSSLESFEVKATQYPDNTIVKHDPYYLEMEWEDFNEVGGDHFSSNNYTETLAIGAVPTTIVIVDRSSMKGDSMVQQPLSGRGQVYSV